MIFVLPVCRNSSFHVHHWYWTWLIGMHANHDAWWSQAAGAFLWGGYINGIARRGAGRVSIRPESSLSAQAAWGRDDVLGCERSLYGAVDQGVSLHLYASGSGGRRLRARLADLLPRAPLIGSPPPSDLRKHPRSLD